MTKRGKMFIGAMLFLSIVTISLLVLYTARDFTDATDATIQLSHGDQEEQSALDTASVSHPNRDAPQRTAVLAPSDANPSPDTFLVVVESAEGRPLRGARVIGDGAEFVTSERGEVALNEAPQVLCVAHPEHAPWAERLDDELRSRSSLRIRLGHGLDLRVRALDHQDEPVVNAEVRVARGSTVAAADWIETLMPATKNSIAGSSVVYGRVGITDGHGEVEFKGLSSGLHHVEVHADGFVDDSSSRNVTIGRAIELDRGVTEIQIRLQRVYAQVIKAINKTGLPKKIFRRLIQINGVIPAGAEGLGPEHSAVAAAARRRVRVELDESDEERIFVCLARSSAPFIDDGGVVNVGYLYGGEWDVAPRWQPLSELHQRHCVTVVVTGRVPVGQLRVVSPYPIAAYPRNTKGHTTFLAFDFSQAAPRGHTRSLPVGDYVLRPSDSTMLGRSDRSTKVRIVEGEEVLVDLSEAAKVATLRVDVRNAGGRTATGVNIKLFRLNEEHELADYRSFRPEYGRAEVICEPGRYRIVVMTGDGEVAFQNAISVSGGEEKTVPVTLE